MGERQSKVERKDNKKGSNELPRLGHDHLTFLTQGLEDRSLAFLNDQNYGMHAFDI